MKNCVMQRSQIWNGPSNMESAGSLPMESVENVGRKEIVFPTEENVKISVSVDHQQ